MSNAVSVKNIIRKRIYEIPQTRWKAQDIYNAIAQLCNLAPTNSHTPWNMEGTDVFDTEILY